MISAKVAFSLRREESRIANDRVIHRSFQVPVQACLNSAIVSAERDGYFGLRQSLTGVFGDAVSFLFFQVIEEHRVTQDGHSVAQDLNQSAVLSKKYLSRRYLAGDDMKWTCPHFCIMDSNPRFAPEAARKDNQRRQILKYWTSRVFFDPQ